MSTALTEEKHVTGIREGSGTAASRINGGAGWWKSPSPDLARASAGKLAEATRLVELDVPTWAVGPSVGGGPPAERPADILKVWPEREPVRRLRPEEFNPILEKLATTHCQ